MFTGGTKVRVAGLMPVFLSTEIIIRSSFNRNQINMKPLKHKRRDFLRETAALAGGMMLSGLPVEKSVFANPSDQPIRLALVGCGGRGTGAAMQALLTSQDVKLVAMADLFRDRLDQCFRSLTSERISDWSGASGQVKDRVAVTEETKFVGFDAYKKAIAVADVVILATPPGYRPYHLEEAVLQDKHVFAEKPLATDGPGIRKVFDLVKLVDEKKLSVVIGLQKHYDNKYIEVVRRIHDGLIGDIVSGQVYYNSEGVWVKEREPDQTEMEYQNRNWYYFNWLCGDHIVEQHIHNIDAFNWTKQKHPVRAQGQGGRQVRTGKEYGEIYDHHFVEFIYDDDSILNSQCRHIKGCMNKIGEHIIGTKGKVEFEGQTASVLDHKGKVLYRHRGKDDPNPYQVEHDQLFASIVEGKPINDLQNGAEATLTTLLGRFASYSGQMVSRDEVLNSTRQLMPAEVQWNDMPPTLPDEKGFYPIPQPSKYKII